MTQTKRTAGGRILIARWKIRYINGKWRPTTGGGMYGDMTILEARAECKRRNRK